jgi:phospholipid/cholesterol/gamma-HCH transport system permease protein
MAINFINSFLEEVGDVSRFTFRFFSELFKTRFEFKEFLRQCFYIGNKSIGLVMITAFIMGLVITIQSRPTLVDFGAEAWLPKMVSVSLIREIAPVITALICAGKIGSGIGAELGSMKVTEQIDAMDVSGTNPYNYLVVTRVMATTLMIPFLVILADAVSLYGAYLGANIHGVVSWNLFWNQVFDTIVYSDITPSILKTYFFGFFIGIIGCYKGFNSKKGTEGVGQSANSAVVISSLLVFIIDLLAVQITDVLNIN